MVAYNALIPSIYGDTNCTYTVGNSSIVFNDGDFAWTISSLVCDGTAKSGTFLKNSTITSFGSCAQMGASDYDNYWKFKMGMLCYPEFSKLIQAKADVTIAKPYIPLAES
jgi:hypothetical protein